MNQLRKVGQLMATALFVLAISSFTNAQTRTFISSTGSNVSVGCPRTAPCRNYQAAINAVANGGEVVPIDSASLPLREFMRVSPSPLVMP